MCCGVSFSVVENDIAFRPRDPRPWRILHIFRDGTAQIELYCSDAWIHDKCVPLSELTAAPPDTLPMRTPQEILSGAEGPS